MSKSFSCPKISQNIPRLGNRFSVWLGKSVLKVMGWRFQGEFPDHRKMVIAVAPHTSNWDFVVGLAVVFSLRLKISFFGKHSIFIPPFDRLLKRWGGIPIERSRSHGVVSKMIQTIKQADQIVLALSPEGTRSGIYPWKTGFLHIAKEAEIPVVLIGLDYKNKLICLGPEFKVEQDIETEMQKVYDYYANIPAKYADKILLPTEKNIEQ